MDALRIEDHQQDLERLYAEIAGPQLVNRTGSSTSAGGKIPQGQRHNTLVSLAGSMRKRGMSEAAIYAALCVENARCEPPYDEQHVLKISESAGKWAPDPVAAENERPNLLEPLFNDHGNAERLILLYGEDMRFNHDFRRWQIFDGTRWNLDTTDQCRRYAKQAMLQFLQQAIEQNSDDAVKFARASLDARRITNMLSMAESEIYIQPADLDTNPDLLNFLNGTVDLRTGELRPHQRTDYITKLVHFNYKPAAQCPLWLRFLEDIMGGGPDASEGAIERANGLLEYLQKAIGYSLTGLTIEKAVFFVFGEGDNGKSTMLNAIRRLVEEYSVLLQVETLMVRPENNNAQADLADLRGARFVQTSETEEGQRLAQGKLKRIAQGMGRIKATRKYENPIEFNETHKLWVDTNRKPTIRDADDVATFNRIHAVPFTVKIPRARIDRELPNKLLGEAEGILAWAVQGAKKWYAFGLEKPPEVQAANDEWRAEMDQVGRFIEDRCVLGEGFTVMAGKLYAVYRNWVKDSGETVELTMTAFCTKLGKRDKITKKKVGHGMQYSGIAPSLAEDAGSGG